MNDPNAVCVAVIMVYWVAWLTFVVCFSTASWMPVIPVVPLMLAGAGWMANAIFPWAGTTLVVIVHLGLITRDTWILLGTPSASTGEQSVRESN